MGALDAWLCAGLSEVWLFPRQQKISLPGGVRGHAVDKEIKMLEDYNSLNHADGSASLPATPERENVCLRTMGRTGRSAPSPFAAQLLPLGTTRWFLAVKYSFEFRNLAPVGENS